MHDLDKQHQALIEELKHQGIHNKRILDVLTNIPRHLFMDIDDLEHSYENAAQAIDCGQTISQPYIVALMSQALAPKFGGKVLEIGTGSGYQTAVLSQLFDQVYTVERHPELSSQAKEVLSRLEYTNISYHLGDGSCGWSQHQPYDAIIVTAASPEVPKPLIEELSADSGLLVIPVQMKTEDHQDLQLLKKTGQNTTVTSLGGVRFVPLVGQHGF